MNQRKSTVDSLIEAVKESGTLLEGKPVVLLLSGGRDSVCLLDVLAKLLKRDQIVALHINYRLRGSESDADQLFCEKLCKQMGIKLTVETAEYPMQGNKQAWARSVRYQAAEQVANPLAASIATAHTADDQVETTLYRLISSPGSNGLVGMKASNGNRIKPLLKVWRKDVTQYCKEAQLSWREDSTNSQPVYIRNRVRNELIPLLNELHSGAVENISTTIGYLQEESAALSELTIKALDSERSFTLDRLNSVPAGMRRLLVKQLAEQVAGQSVAISQSCFEEIINLMSKPGTKSLDIGQGLVAVSEYGELQIKVASTEKLSPQRALLEVPGTVSFGELTVCCEKVDKASEYGVLDASLFSQPALTVRSRRPGDSIRPVGLGGSKLLKDIFIDRKIPRSTRSLLPVVESAGELVCVPGVVYSEKFVASEEPVCPVRFYIKRSFQSELFE